MGKRLVEAIRHLPRASSVQAVGEAQLLEALSVLQAVHRYLHHIALGNLGAALIGFDAGVGLRHFLHPRIDFGLAHRNGRNRQLKGFVGGKRHGAEARPRCIED